MGNQSIISIEAVIDYIESHLDGKLELETVAEAVHYSKYHLHRLFTETVGMTIHDYVQRRQLTEAAKLLVFSDKPIIEIAFICGYESQQSFSLAFKAMYKSPPAEYREEQSFYPLQLRFILHRRTTAMEFTIQDIRLAEKKDIVDWMNLMRLALVPVSKKSASVYKSVVILYKSIFRAAMESRIIDHNPTIYLTTKGGGVPQEDRQALTDEQAERLLDAIRDLPPYVFVMIGLYAGLRREEILALQWDSVYLDTDTPYLTVRRAWHTEHNRPVISDELKTKAAERNIPLPVCLAECLKAAKEASTSEYVVSNRDGDPLSYTQFKRLWQYIVTRTVKERSYYRYEDGKRVKHTVTPVLGEKAAHNGKVVYSLDFEVTPHQLRHTYITNLIHASVDPKTVQYLAGHESSKITMDIYAKVKYNRPDELVRSMSCAFASWDTAQ